jgi:hypothetical protein
MDEVSDQSPLLTVILLWDKVQYVLEDHPWFLFQCFFLITYLFFLGARTDFYLVVSFLLWFNLTPLLQSLSNIVTTWRGRVIVAVGAIIALDFKLDLVRYIFQEPDDTCSSEATPYFIPSRTTHTRLSPKKHSFSYSYLLAGIPVDFYGNVNGILSVPSSSNSSLRRRAWFNVEPADYLERGLKNLGLRAKLDSYLQSQVI